MSRSLIAVALVTTTLATAGCAKYWTRDQATLSDFAKDHQECITSTGVPVVTDPRMVVPREDDYRRCLISRGWDRRNASWVAVPAGYYRGYEEREEYKAVRIDQLPDQPTAATTPPPPPPRRSTAPIELVYRDPSRSGQRMTTCAGESAEVCAQALERQGWVRVK